MWCRKKAIYHHRQRRRLETTSAELPWMKQRTPFCGGSSTRPASLIWHVSLRIFWPSPSHLRHQSVLSAVGVITHGRRTKPFPENGNSILFFNKNVDFLSRCKSQEKGQTSWMRWSAESGSDIKILFVLTNYPLHGRTQESRRVGSFCFQVDQNVLGRSPGSSRGVRGHAPPGNFGKMEPNPAILCILAVKSEWLQHGPLTKSTQKLKKKFRSVERTLWPRGRVLPNLLGYGPALVGIPVLCLFCVLHLTKAT